MLLPLVENFVVINLKGVIGQLPFLSSPILQCINYTVNVLIDRPLNNSHSRLTSAKKAEIINELHYNVISTHCYNSKIFNFQTQFLITHRNRLKPAYVLSGDFHSPTVMTEDLMF
jgi:hypothetical protein